MDRKDLKILKGLLPDDYLTKLKAKFGLTENYIRKILNGDHSRVDVIAHAIELAELYQKELEDMAKRIHSLANGE
ncbi:MAG TPA: hypothetical protein DCL77_14470 [Prolixibacteraceae bacterium]|jgi:hypothetical protein|nr:hypothetical protein [Prolixibacteraceae bacterium]